MAVLHIFPKRIRLQDCLATFFAKSTKNADTINVELTSHIKKDKLFEDKCFTI